MLIVDTLTSYFFARDFSTVGRRSRCVFLSGEKIARASASLGEFQFFLSSLNHLYRAPNLFLSPPLRCSRPFPIFSCENHPDTYSCLDLQKNSQGFCQFGGISKYFSSRKRLVWPQNLLSRHPLGCSCPYRIFLLILPLTPTFVFYGEKNPRASASFGAFQNF